MGEIKTSHPYATDALVRQETCSIDQRTRGLHAVHMGDLQLPSVPVIEKICCKHEAY